MSRTSPWLGLRIGAASRGSGSEMAPSTLQVPTIFSAPDALSGGVPGSSPERNVSPPSLSSCMSTSTRQKPRGLRPRLFSIFKSFLPGGHSRPVSSESRRSHIASQEDILVSPRARPQLPIEETPDSAGDTNLASPEDILVSGFCRPRRPTEVCASSPERSRRTSSKYSQGPTAAASYSHDPAPQQDNTPQGRFSALTSADPVAESRNSERAQKLRLRSHDTSLRKFKSISEKINPLRARTQSKTSLEEIIQTNTPPRTNSYPRPKNKNSSSIPLPTSPLLRARTQYKTSPKEIIHTNTPSRPNNKIFSSIPLPTSPFLLPSSPTKTLPPIAEENSPKIPRPLIQNLPTNLVVLGSPHITTRDPPTPRSKFPIPTKRT